MIAPDAGQGQPTTSLWGTRRLWSLWDMINFSLSGLITAMNLVREHKSRCVASAIMTPNTPVDDVYKGIVENNVAYLGKICAQMLLERADDRLFRTHATLRRRCTFDELEIELRVLLEAVEADLAFERFFHYPRHKGQLLLVVPGEWGATIAAFPSAEVEITRGVDCYALLHNAACVFHMMRVAEIGMRALARERQVTFPKHPLEWAEWENVIDQIESKAKAATAGMSRGPERDAARGFYTAAVAQLRAFKETRNRIMHMRGDFDELDAQRAMGQVRDFMNGLSAKVDEKTRRPIRKWP
jgi:hypothetical protein